MDSQLRLIFVYSLMTAMACGLGAIPFFFLKNISKQGVGIAKSIAAGLMVAASFTMIQQGLEYGIRGIFGGMIIGLSVVIFSKKIISGHKTLSFGSVKGKDAGQLLLFLGIMTVHSGTEGIAMGFAFGPSWSLGLLIAGVMAIQNIPEGLAIASVMVPQGVSPRKAVGRSIFSSLPQPLIAVPAFLFVSFFEPLISWGLGFAAGAMIWMAFGDLLPDALEKASKGSVAITVTLSIAFMVLIEQVLSF